MSKVFVYGVDGGSYPLIQSFIEEGYLPNYAKLIKDGVFKKFISTIPPHTAPGWVSISTGVNPGTHGVYQFWKTQGKDYIGSYQGATDWGKEAIWKILNDYNLKTGVINVPMTHSPIELDGFMISWPLSKTLNYCYPKTLLNEIMNAGGYFYPDIYVMYDGQDEYLKTACDITRKRVKTIKYLIQNKKWDFFMVVFPEVDRISHFYWNYMDKNSPHYKEDPSLRDAILKMYIEVDKAMGEIIDIISEDTLFVSLSDHGFRVGTVNFNINTFLVQNGYMKLKETGVRKDKEGKEEQSGDYIYGNWFHTSDGEKDYEVDFNNTKLFISAPGSYGINFNLMGRQKNGIVRVEEKQELFNKLKEELLKIQHPYKKDVPLFKDIVWGKDLYHGEKENLAPDIMLIPHDFSVMVSHHLSMNEIFSEPEQKGMHCRDGYVLFYGKDVQPGEEFEECEVTDFAPTILKYFGIEPPNYMEGKLLEIFKEGVIENTKLLIKKEKIDDTNSKDSFKESYSDSEKKDIEERLKSLGYL